MPSLAHQIFENRTKTALLIGVVGSLVIGLGWVAAVVFNAPNLLFLAVLVAGIQALIGYFISDRIALAISRAKPLERRQAPKLHELTEDLVRQAGLPKPRLYLIDEASPNAFATGRDPRHASVAVTRGLVERLNREELRAVLAHELAHIRNFDIRLMTIVVVLVGIISLIGDGLLRLVLLSGGDREGAQARAILLPIALVFAIIAPLVAILLQLAISRRREFLADASAASLTGQPLALASALAKIASDRTPLLAATKATAHLFIADPLKAHQGRDPVGWFARLFATHPPVEERIRRLRALAK